MKLILTTDDGEVLDSMAVSPSEYREEVAASPNGLVAMLQPGDAALNYQ